MANTLKIKRSTTGSSSPSSLADGELAINQADEKLFYKNSDGTIKSTTLSTTPVAEGGTGSTTASGARSNLGAAASGANADITSLTSGPIGIGTTTTTNTKVAISANAATLQNPLANTVVQIGGLDTAIARVRIEGYGNRSQLELYRANGTAASPSLPVANDILGLISGQGYASANVSNGSPSIQFSAAENWVTASAIGSFIDFATVKKTTTTALTQMRLDDAGGLTIAKGSATPAGGTAGLGLMLGTTANLGVFFGSGAPTLSAAQGSLYLRTDGSSTSTRMYVNTNGTTGWTAVTTAS